MLVILEVLVLMFEVVVLRPKVLVCRPTVLVLRFKVHVHLALVPRFQLLRTRLGIRKVTILTNHGNGSRLPTICPMYGIERIRSTDCTGHLVQKHTNPVILNFVLGQKSLQLLAPPHHCNSSTPTIPTFISLRSLA